MLIDHVTVRRLIHRYARTGPGGSGEREAADKSSRVNETHIRANLKWTIAQASDSSVSVRRGMTAKNK